jgi:hypothetical protein
MRYRYAPFVFEKQVKLVCLSTHGTQLSYHGVDSTACATAGLLLVSALLLIYTALVVPVQIFLWDYSDSCNRLCSCNRFQSWD